MNNADKIIQEMKNKAPEAIYILDPNLNTSIFKLRFINNEIMFFRCSLDFILSYQPFLRQRFFNHMSDYKIIIETEERLENYINNLFKNFTLKENFKIMDSEEIITYIEHLALMKEII